MHAMAVVPEGSRISNCKCVLTQCVLLMSAACLCVMCKVYSKCFHYDLRCHDAELMPIHFVCLCNSHLYAVNCVMRHVGQRPV